jgi:hypothetical protein
MLSQFSSACFHVRMVSSTGVSQGDGSHVSEYRRRLLDLPSLRFASTVMRICCTALHIIGVRVGTHE